MSGLPIGIDEPQPGQLAYRVFRLDAAGAVQSMQIIEARTDDEARAIAQGLVNGFGIDLWERARFLASYPPLSAAYPQDC